MQTNRPKERPDLQWLQERGEELGIYFATFRSPLGWISYFAQEIGLYKLDFDERLKEEFRGNHPVIKYATEWLQAYFDGKKPGTEDLPLAPSGTDFMRSVWRHISQIPYGSTLTYGEIAKAMNSSPRAVGKATGCNPICLIIPCHRVIGAGGKLTGYAAGIERKKWLLQHEAGSSA